jgi:hypothetical protein
VFGAAIYDPLAPAPEGCFSAEVPFSETGSCEYFRVKQVTALSETLPEHDSLIQEGLTEFSKKFGGPWGKFGTQIVINWTSGTPIISQVTAGENSRFDKYTIRRDLRTRISEQYDETAVDESTSVENAEAENPLNEDSIPPKEAEPVIEKPEETPSAKAQSTAISNGSSSEKPSTISPFPLAFLEQFFGWLFGFLG